MKSIVLIAFAFAFNAKAFAFASKDTTADSLLITIILKHQQDKNLKEIEKKQDENKYWDLFPPKQARVISWYAVMGLGQIVTLKVAPKDLRILNRSIAEGAWGAFTTEIYPAYDYEPVMKERMKAKPRN